jgi:ABC-type polysaccharide/polyol phosphate transport system ATPase subunit
MFGFGSTHFGPFISGYLHWEPLSAAVSFSRSYVLISQMSFNKFFRNHSAAVRKMKHDSTWVQPDCDSSSSAALPSEYPIIVENLSKIYKLYDKPIDRLKESLSPFRKKYHRDFFALDSVSFEVKKGEALGVIGKNGSGKSTLLKIISGILTPTSGNVKVNGKISALLELGTGFNPELTGLENIYFSGIIMGYSREDMDRKVDDILSFADIGKFAYQPVKTYSSGMFVRLAFAVAVSVNPEILIIDEALSVGDMRFSMKCIRKMKDLIAGGTSQIFVSHDMTSIVNFCQEVIWLNDGKIFQRGNPKKITINYANYMAYGFLPPEMNFDQEIPDSDDAEYRAVSYQIEAEIQNREVEFISFDNLNWINLNGLPSSGEGGAFIKRMAIRSMDGGRNYVVFVGGENCEIFLDIQTNHRLLSPVCCADFRDKKGNLIFGLNTLFIGPNMKEISANKRVIVNFKFKMPLLLTGEYSIAVGLGDGCLESHIQHHIVMEAIIINIVSTDLSRSHYMVALESSSYVLNDITTNELAS